MRANVKPLTHWIIYKQYTVRFTQRHPAEVKGVLKTPDGEIEFRYDPQKMIVYLPDQRITINEHGWELETECITNSS
jgi:hypothetical protein